MSYWGQVHSESLWNLTTGNDRTSYVEDPEVRARIQAKNRTLCRLMLCKPREKEASSMTFYELLSFEQPFTLVRGRAGFDRNPML
jgi:hypothetical protein